MIDVFENLLSVGNNGVKLGDLVLCFNFCKSALCLCRFSLGLTYVVVSSCHPIHVTSSCIISMTSFFCLEVYISIRRYELPVLQSTRPGACWCRTHARCCHLPAGSATCPKRVHASTGTGRRHHHHSDKLELDGRPR